MGVDAPFGGLVVHPLDEGLLAPGDVFRQGHGTVVGGHHGFANYTHCQLRADTALPPVRVSLGTADSVQPVYPDAGGTLMEKIRDSLENGTFDEFREKYVDLLDTRI